MDKIPVDDEQVFDYDYWQLRLTDEQRDRQNFMELHFVVNPVITVIAVIPDIEFDIN